MGLTDEQLQVVVSAVTEKFQKDMGAAQQSLIDLGAAGTKTINSIHKAETSFVNELARGQGKRELRGIAVELGNLGGVGGIAGKQMNAFLGILGSLASPLGIAVAAASALAAGIGFLAEQNKKAAEEAKKQEQAMLDLAASYGKAKKAQAELTDVQVAAGEVAKKAETAKFAKLVDEDRVKIEALEKQLRIYQKALSDTLNSQVVVQSSVEGLTKAVDLEKDKLALARAELQAHEKGLVDAKTAMDAAAESAKDLNEVTLGPETAATRAWRDYEEQLKRTADANKKLTQMMAADTKKFHADQKKAWDQAMSDFNSATSGMQNAFSGFLTDAALGVESLDAAWKTFTDNLVKSAVEALANAAVKALFNAIGGSLIGGAAAEGGGGGIFGMLGSIFGLADGNARVTSPTLAVIGEGPEPENVLTDSQLAAMSGGGVTIQSLTIRNEGGGPSTRSQAYALGESQAAGLARGLARLNLRIGRRPAFGTL